MSIALSLTAAERPHYLEKVLESWSAVDGVERLPAVFNVEPVNDDVFDMCASATFFATNVTIRNRHRYGALANPWYAIHRAFEERTELGYVDFVIVGEDDSVVSTDVLRYFTWARERMMADPSIFAACAFRKRYPDQEPGAYVIDFDRVSMSDFSPTIWGITRQVWDDRVRDTWAFLYRDKGWDWKFNEQIAPGNQCLRPWVSRSQHIGWYGGAHMPPEEFKINQSDCFVADPPPVEFRLV